MKQDRSTWLDVVIIVTVIVGLSTLILPFVGVYRYGGPKALALTLGALIFFGWIVLLPIALALLLWKRGDPRTQRRRYLGAGLLACAVLWGASLLYRTGRSYQRAERQGVISCQYRLGEIYSAVSTYASLNDGQMPPSLDLLVDKTAGPGRWRGGRAWQSRLPGRYGVPGGRVPTTRPFAPGGRVPFRRPGRPAPLWSPSLAERAAPDSRPADEPYSIPEAYLACSVTGRYVYRPAAKGGPATPICWEAHPHVVKHVVLRFWKNEVRNVLFADGRVEMIDEDAFQKLRRSEMPFSGGPRN